MHVDSLRESAAAYEFPYIGNSGLDREYNVTGVRTVNRDGRVGNEIFARSFNATVCVLVNSRCSA